MLVLKIEPGEAPRRLELSHSLEEMQKAVGGFIQILYPFEDPVALVCKRRGSYWACPPTEPCGTRAALSMIVCAELSSCAELRRTAIHWRG